MSSPAVRCEALTRTDQKPMAAFSGGGRVTNSKGTRYRLIIDLGTKPDGSRHQFCQTFDRLSDAKAKHASSST